eukprot:7726374-Alexandrium_andersonii.AAC.1
MRHGALVHFRKGWQKTSPMRFFNLAPRTRDAHVGFADPVRVVRDPIEVAADDREGLVLRAHPRSEGSPERAPLSQERAPR